MQSKVYRCNLILQLLLLSSFVILAENSKCVEITEVNDLVITCSNLRLLDIPQDLNQNVQDLRMDINYVEKLKQDVFFKYPNLTTLHLEYNFIHAIDYETFSHLLFLKELYLFGNKLFEIPQPIFDLPELKYLYLNHNHFEYFDCFGSNESKLELVDLSWNWLKSFPNFYIFPKINTLLLHRNQISDITVENLEYIYSLKTLSISENFIDFKNRSSDCYLLNSLLKNNNVVIDERLLCNESLSYTNQRVGNLESEELDEREFYVENYNLNNLSNEEENLKLNRKLLKNTIPLIIFLLIGFCVWLYICLFFRPSSVRKYTSLQNVNFNNK